MSLYEEFAATYARHTASSLWNASYERPALQEIVGDVRGRTVLDAGCASGELSAWLLQQGAKVTALDRSAAFLAMIRERLSSPVDVVQADLAKQLPFSDAAFDVIVSSLTLHYVANWDALMCEFFRVTKPGGRLLFSTHHPSVTATLAANYFTTALVDDTFTIDGVAYPVQYYHRSLEGIVAPILSAGFTIRAMREPILNVKPEQPWFLILDCARAT
ncbi:MAG: class I SAM-dependent methyltransferase [Candidatus Eremiobacteraeota bacterium]|nr:class I SAM-dependent methyltransferase [Candidatus Eremiobacteraeota bacterium]